MGKIKSVVCQFCYRVMRSDYLKTHIMKRHQKRLDTETLHTSNISPIRPLINKDIDSNLEFKLFSTTSVHKPSNLDRESIIRKLKIDKAEYLEKLEAGRAIYEYVIKYEIPEASIPIEYQEPLEIYMKGNKTDESNFITNSNQSEITLLEDTLLGDTILKDTTAATVLKIYKLLQRMTNKNV